MTMMKGRSQNLQGIKSIENSMDPRAKEKHEEEHEDRESQDYQLDLNPLKAIK
jgi:hypothetical protein